MIKGLNIGADDYITKPFRIKEVIARINALQRRMNMFQENSKPVISFNHRRLLVNFDSKEVYIDGKRVRLTITEFKLLEDRKSTRLNSSHVAISYYVFFL